MNATRLVACTAAAALLLVLGIGLTQLGGSSSSSPRSHLTAAQMRERLRGSPAVLEALHAQSALVLSGGLPALRTRLAALHGRPVVINKWASWCAPCRAEFGVFQAVAVADGRRVAFIGLDSGDQRGDAESFLRSFPVSFPSYFDPDDRAAIAITDSASTPVTVFYNGRGGQYIRQGPYPSVAKLQADIARYALGA